MAVSLAQGTGGGDSVRPVPDAAAHDRRRAVLAGHRGDEREARALLHDLDPGVRAAALNALARMGTVTAADVAAALDDVDASVRRRACAVAAAHSGLAVDLTPLLADGDASVVEAAAWGLGERGSASAGAVADLARIVASHPDALCREAAVAALGAIGDWSGLPAILAATRDRPAVRRRAVIALAPFDGPEVDEALQRALADRDWQVRQAAEDLLDVRAGETGAPPATGPPPP
jgi:HEAT repeat protein